MIVIKFLRRFRRMSIGMKTMFVSSFQFVLVLNTKKSELSQLKRQLEAYENVHLRDRHGFARFSQKDENVSFFIDDSLSQGPNIPTTNEVEPDITVAPMMNDRTRPLPIYGLEVARPFTRRRRRRN